MDGNIQKVKALITVGADVNATDEVSIHQDQYYNMTNKYIL